MRGEEGHTEGLAEGLAEGRAEGRAEGIAEGQAKAAKLIAKNLLAVGTPLELIAKATGLTIGEIEKLSASLIEA